MMDLLSAAVVHQSSCRWRTEAAEPPPRLIHASNTVVHRRPERRIYLVCQFIRYRHRLRKVFLFRLIGPADGIMQIAPLGRKFDLPTAWNANRCRLKARMRSTHHDHYDARAGHLPSRVRRSDKVEVVSDAFLRSSPPPACAIRLTYLLMLPSEIAMPFAMTMYSNGWMVGPHFWSSGRRRLEF